MTDIEIITEALNVIDAYINNGAPLPPKTNPYWRADAAIETIRSRLAALDRLSAPPSESARKLLQKAFNLIEWRADGTVNDSNAVALIESSWARVREECVESWKTAMCECAEILPNKVECVLTGSDVERIEAAILAQPKEIKHG